MSIPEERYVDITRPGETSGGANSGEVRDLKRRLDQHIGSGGQAHAVATETSAGFMSSDDKAKTNGIQNEATKNMPDDYLLARGNHTGVQAIETVNGLREELDELGGAELEALVAQAEAAAEEAEAASNAAFINADVYPDVASGLAAVADGEQFQVVEGDEVVRYRRDSASSYTEVARYPSAGRIRDIEMADFAEVYQPNLLTNRQISFEDLPTPIGATLLVQRDNGAPRLRVTSVGSNARTFWAIPREQVEGSLVSAQITLVSANEGSSGAVRIFQRDSSGGILDTTVISQESLGAAINDPRIFRVSAVPVLPATASIELDVLMSSASGSRTFTVEAPMIAVGSNSAFRLSAPGAGGGGPSTSVYENAEYTKRATNVLRVTHEKPLDIPVMYSANESSVSPGTEEAGQVYDLNVASTATTGSGVITAARLSEQGLKAGEVIQLSAVVETAAGTQAIGLGFGSTDSVRGFGVRKSAQMVTLNLPAGTTGGISGPAPRTFVAGESIQVDARLLSGSAGNWTVRCYVQYEDGERFGPYDLTDVPSLDGIWFMGRSGGEWSGIRLYRFRAPAFADELIESGSGSAGLKIVHVSTTGNDENSGSTAASPLRTISKALAEIDGSGIVELAGGEYRETVNASSEGLVFIRSRVGERAVILGSDRLVVTKAAGYSQVYQAPLTSKPTGMGGSRGQPAIFEWGTPSKPIPADERHPMQRGKSYRLPYTEMNEAASLAELDTESGRGKWWWESGVIYFSATDGGDATSKRYEARARPTLQRTAGFLMLSRIDVLFSSNDGVELGGNHAETQDVTVLGSHRNGFYHTSGFWLSSRDEAGGCGNDGFNGTVASRDPDDESGTRITAVIHDPYGHDNGDDGISYHYRSDATTHGGLFEHNTKADVVHVTGASVTCYDTVANGSQHGFYAASPPDGDDARVVASLRCVGTVAINNQYSYRVASGCYMECSNVVAVNPSVYGYAQSGDGVLVARNSKYTGDPAKMKDGIVEVINDGALT